MVHKNDYPEMTIGLRIKFIPHCLLRGLLKALFYLMGFYSCLVYFAEFLSYLKNGVVDQAYRGEFFVIEERLRPTGWIGLDDIIHEAYTIFLTPAFFFWFSVVGSVLYTAFSDDVASQEYKKLDMFLQMEIDEQVGYFAVAWGLFILMSLIVSH